MLQQLLFGIFMIPYRSLCFLKKFCSCQGKPYPPGPFRLPFIGSLWRLGINLSETTFRKLAKQYGNIYSLWIGNQHAVILSGYKAVKEGLIDNSQAFVDRPPTPFLSAITKNRGIAFSSGHVWIQQRRFGVVTMRKLGLGRKGLETQIQAEAQQLVEFITNTKGHAFDPAIPITNSICNVICAAAFGYRFPIEDKDFSELMEAIRVTLKFAATVSHGLYEVFPYIMKYLPGPHQTVKSACKRIISFVKKQVKQHKENQNLHEPQDFIDFYLFQMEKSKDHPNSTYNEDNLIQCIFDLFIAGTDTTSSSIKWALLLMANHLDVQDKVHKEIKEVLGSSQSICYQDRKKVPYTNAVIHEIIRSKYILLFGLPRECVKDVYMGNFLIPKGAILTPDLRSVLLDPEHWETPEEFNPNHFLDKEGNFVPNEAFLPFGAGARVCLGELLAKIEIFIVFASLLRGFRFQPPEGVEKLSQKTIVGLTIHSVPYKICALPRINSS
ncbi:cytochrome P450 2J2-like [Pituophis catenifer annectens]|uniref:cytochrome P450 2J2-like n=1 Tax=Pituophis catenifer annectens TaxID=94852 RepID=UPI003995C2D8